MDLTNHTLPPQEYVVHDNQLYRIQWVKYPQIGLSGKILREGGISPRKLIDKDDRIFWVTENGVIFSSNTEKRDIKIISLVDFYILSTVWNIPINNFTLNIPLL